MIKPRLNWNGNDGEGSVTFPKGFDEQDWVVKADALQDWIVDLTDKYNSLMSGSALEELAGHGQTLDVTDYEIQSLFILACGFLAHYINEQDERFIHGALQICEAGAAAIQTGERQTLKIGGLVDEILALHPETLQ